MKKQFIPISAFLCWFLFSFLFVQSQDKLSPELLWKLSRLNEPVVSPDGKSVVIGISKTDLKENKSNRDLFILHAPDFALNKLTDLPGGESNARWRPDGKKIGFLSNKSSSSQLWEILPDGSGLTQVTNVEGGIYNFAWSPDARHISFTRDVKMDKTVNEIYPDLPKANAKIIDDLMYRHWDSWSDQSYSHLFIMDYGDGLLSGEPKDVMPGEKYDTPLMPMGGAEQIAWSPDGSSIVYTSKKLSGKEYAVSTNSDLYQYNLSTGATKNLTQGLPGYDQDPVFSPDGKKLIWLSMARAGFESDKNRIMVLDLATMKLDDLTMNFDQSADLPVWSSDQKKLYFTSGIKATVQIFELDLDSKKFRQITSGRHNYSAVQMTSSGLVAMKQSMDSPNELWLVDPATGKEKQLTFANRENLDKVRMGQVEERHVTTTDGKDMLVWIIYPPDFVPTKKYPALLYCQGGPQSTVNQFFSTRWNFQLMASNGYIVVAPNRRGLPSFGQEWNDEISGDWGGQCMADYLTAIDNVKREKYIDSTKIGAVGASFGGYSVYYLAGIHNHRFNCFIAHCGLFNLESWYSSTEEMFFANWDLKGAYWQNPQPPSYQGFSPHKFVQNWDTPMLVIHGEKDFRVPVTQGMEAFGVAQNKGIPSRFLYFPEEGHWVQSPQNSVVWQRVFFEWLDRWLK